MVDIAAIRHLVLEMGFDGASARRALELTDGDAQQAAVLLLDWAEDGGATKGQLQQQSSRQPEAQQQPEPEAQPAPAGRAASIRQLHTATPAEYGGSVVQPRTVPGYWHEQAEAPPLTQQERRGRQQSYGKVEPGTAVGPTTTPPTHEPIGRWGMPTEEAPPVPASAAATKAQRKNAKRANKRQQKKMTQPQHFSHPAQTTLRNLKTLEREGPIIVWLRQDLRLDDNAALHAAAGSGRAVIPLFIRCPSSEEGGWPLGGAVKLWLHEALRCFGESLATHCSSRLILRNAAQASTLTILGNVVQEVGAAAVVWNRLYEPWFMERDAKIAQVMRRHGVEAEEYPGAVLYEPQITNPTDCAESLTKGFASVGFYTSACRALSDVPPLPLPSCGDSALVEPAQWPASERLEELELMRYRNCKAGPRRRQLDSGELAAGLYPLRQACAVKNGVVDWGTPIRRHWRFGEAGAQAALALFLATTVAEFDDPEQRFRADGRHTAELSPYLKFGELSPRAVFHKAATMHGRKHSHTFLRRLAWRDLTYWMLWKFPSLPDFSFRPWFERQEWAVDPGGVRRAAWEQAQTGYPLVDAAMTQLWKTGWMPNYMRHVVAGFLVEYLRLDWRVGERWFHDTLVDADVAINAYMWQNGGHSGPDQWNFVMHPVYAAKKCDPEGTYVRRWLPALARLDNNFIHAPWDAPPSLLAAAGVRLGSHYPRRVVVNLDQERRLSHRAVMAVRASAEGRRHTNPSGHEWLLVDGKRVTCITRCDYREGRADGQPMSDAEIDAEVQTRQTAAEMWDPRRMGVRRGDARSLAIEDTTQAFQGRVEHKPGGRSRGSNRGGRAGRRH